MANNRLTIADLRANKGKRQYSMLRVETMDELAAADEAEIDMVSVPPEMMLRPDFRDAGPSVFAVPGLNFYEVGTSDDFIRWAFPLYKAGADAVYCSASLKTIRALADENIPVIGHTGLIPSRATWTGGFKAVGKTKESALMVLDQVRALEKAGAFGAEIECVPTDLASEISAMTSLFLISMGAGAGCDCQYLFSDDVLGQNRGHVPRHAKVYRNFAAEYDRLQSERVAAFREFADDVRTGAYPGKEHQIPMAQEEHAAFRKAAKS
ncbi:MAG: 3-methyl-2-oxobutanoate hydroxymethyltransferase [Rhizobiaceae bacterium]